MFPGFWQVMIILLIVLIFFGAGKLPRVMGDLAQGVKSFKKGMKDEESPQIETNSADAASEAEPAAHVDTRAAEEDRAARG